MRQLADANSYSFQVPQSTDVALLHYVSIYWQNGNERKRERGIIRTRELALAAPSGYYISCRQVIIFVNIFPFLHYLKVLFFQTRRFYNNKYGLFVFGSFFAFSFFL